LADVFVTVQSFGAPGEQAPPAGVVHLASIDGALRVAIESGPELTNAVLARLLERGAKISDPNATESAALRGAFAALLIEAARRAGGAIVWRAVPDAPRTTGGVALDATVFIDEKPYGVRIVASEDPKPTHDFADPVHSRDRRGRFRGRSRRARGTRRRRRLVAGRGLVLQRREPVARSPRRLARQRRGRRAGE
jgi:hypothetical protein